MIESKYTKEFLEELRALPLYRKVQLTQNRIIEWYQHFNGDVCISFSGGKDSTVLLHIARQIFPNIKAVFSNTGLEYPEIQAFVMKQENVDIIRPKMQFPEVISTYGYPLISKEVAEAIYYARRIVPRADAEEEYRERESKQYRRHCLMGNCPDPLGGWERENSLSRWIREPVRGEPNGEVWRRQSQLLGMDQDKRERLTPACPKGELGRLQLCGRYTDVPAEAHRIYNDGTPQKKKTVGVPTAVFHRRRLCGLHGYTETTGIHGTERERERVRRSRGREN